MITELPPLPYRIRPVLTLCSPGGRMDPMQIPTALLLGTLRSQVEPQDLLQIQTIKESERFELMKWALDQADERTPDQIHALLDAIARVPTE